MVPIVDTKICIEKLVSIFVNDMDDEDVTSFKRTILPNYKNTLLPEM